MDYECAICEKKITKTVAEFSEQHYGKYACFHCQKLREKSTKTKDKPTTPNGQSIGMAIKEANAIIIAKTSESMLGKLKPKEWAENVVTYAHALLEEMTKRGL